MTSKAQRTITDELFNPDNVGVKVTLVLRSGLQITGVLMDPWVQGEDEDARLLAIAESYPARPGRYHDDMWLDPAEVVGFRWVAV